jgi:hypothetical protein
MRSKLILITIVSIIVGFGLNFITSSNIENTVEDELEYYNLVSYFEMSDSDFIIPSPSNQQIEELKLDDNVNGLFPFYSYELEIIHNDMTIDSQIINYEAEYSYDFTPFGENRIIEKKDEASYPSAIVDYEYSSVHNVNLGDLLTFSLNGDSTIYTYEINMIIESSPLYSDGFVMLPFEGQLADSIESILSSANMFYYSDCYVDVENTALFESSFLNGYQGLGQLRDRADFESQAEYENYLSLYESVDFDAQVYRFSEQYDDTITRANSFLDSIRDNKQLVFILDVIIIILFNIFLVWFTFSDFKYMSKNGRLRPIKMTLYVAVFNTLLVGVLYFFRLIGYSNITHPLGYYNPYNFITSNTFEYLHIITVVILSILLSYFIYFRSEVNFSRNRKQVPKKTSKKVNDLENEPDNELDENSIEVSEYEGISKEELNENNKKSF